MEPIKFYIGQESGIVVENKDFDKSIFAEQYKQALQICQSIWNEQNGKGRESSNIIAFCGDRGEGKTSCLSTVSNIFSNVNLFLSAQQELNIKLNIPSDEFKTLEIVDPLFFDKSHNLIELLLGQMVAEIIQLEKQDNRNEQVIMERRNDLLKRFEGVKRRLKILSEEAKQEAYDELESLDDLAAGVMLRDELDLLFADYATFFKRRKVLISIDDVDLNMTEGYKMAEEIRKYLSGLRSCILLVALNVDQMERIIMSTMRERLQAIIDNDVIKEMARKYVVKMLPLGNRVQMPSGVDIAEKKLVISDNGQETKPLVVKEFVVRLIFQKTFFIFVNNRDLSPIVPTNLRDLRHLIGDLFALPDAEKDDDKINNVNKQIFKQYLYYVWTKCLTAEHQKGLKEIVENEDVLSINKKVVAFLCDVLDFSTITKDLSEADSKMIERIINPYNQIYNVSLGDVCYLIHRAEQTHADVETKNVLFFLKAFYSIKLYDLYDEITSNQSLDTIGDNKSVANVFNLDTALKGTNILQRFLNGGYFTYAPGAMIPLENGVSRDLRIIDTFKLREIFGSLKDKKNNVENLNLCEFFALTTTYDLKQRDVDTLFDRTKYGPLYIREHTTTNNYLLFDVLSIFYNIVNIEETYRRFNKWCGDKDFYEIAKSNPDSLLQKMFAACTKGEPVLNHIEPDMHGLLSSAVIRVSDVQQSIEENGYSKREKHNVGGNARNLYWIYKDIIDLKMHLYPILAEETKSINLTEDTKNSDGLWKQKGHLLAFKFLEPIITLLDAQDKKGGKLFDEVFASTISLKTSITPEADKDDMDKLNFVFGQALKNISIKFPQKGNAILMTLSQEYPYIYNYLGGKQFVETLIIPSKDYDLEAVYNALSPYSSNVERAFKKYQKDQEKEREKEYRLRKEKEEQERKKNEADQAKQKADRESKERMYKESLLSKERIQVEKNRANAALVEMKYRHEQEMLMQKAGVQKMAREQSIAKQLGEFESKVLDKVNISMKEYLANYEDIFNRVLSLIQTNNDNLRNTKN